MRAFKGRMRYISAFHVTAAFLTVAILFGGGGSPSPLPELVVQLAALAAILIFRLLPSTARTTATPDRAFWMCVAIFLLVPVLQIIPLPPALWQSLPGRETERAALDLIGKADTWRPISLAPYQTLASALALIPPLAIIYLVAALTIPDRTKLLAWIAALALISAFVGVLQLASGDANWMRFYRDTHYGFLTGFQANRNAAADLLLIGSLALCAFVTLWPKRAPLSLVRAIALATTLFLLVAVVLTGSRAGTTLIVAYLAFAIFIYRPKLTFSRPIAIAFVGSLVLLAVGVVALRDNAALDRTWQRFSDTSDARPSLWTDTNYAIGRYWPIGAGVGTFTTVFPAAERLEAVDQSTPNRAHEDYLEFTLETGLAGILLLAGLAGAMIVRIVSILRNGTMGPHAIQALFASGTIAILSLHSLLDYPIRSMSIATLGAASLGLLARAYQPRGVRRTDRFSDQPAETSYR